MRRRANMSRKDYVAIAAALKASRTFHARPNWNAAIDRVTNGIADVLAADNARFDRDRFLRAAGFGLTGDAVETANPRLWFPGGVGIGRNSSGQYMAVSIDTTVGWDFPTLRQLFPESFDPQRLAVVDARLGYEHEGQHGYHLFKIRSGGKWTRPMPLRVALQEIPGVK